MKTRQLLILSVALLGLMFLINQAGFAQATITVVNMDGPGEGFNDPTPVTPVGGNSGATLGAQRLIAFQDAAGIWGSSLSSAVEIRIQASFDPLPCTATSGVLGSAGAASIVSDFPGATFPKTWYAVALANKLAGLDLLPSSNDIVAQFNSSIGTDPNCLTGFNWYYGLDNNHGTNLDLVTVLLHEFAHGLGFASFVDESKGTEIRNKTDIYSRQILDTTTGQTWDKMTVHQRKLSAIRPRKLVWNGAGVTAAVPTVLAQGTPVLAVNSPAGIAGNYDVGEASFGPALTSPGVTGDVVQALDAADTTGPSTTDACTTITNPAVVNGKIALVDRGSCAFTVKVKNCQDAGALAVIVADNVAGSPPNGLSGTDPTITIPSVRITLADGNTIKGALAGGVVNATLGLDMSLRAGANAANQALLYSPNPVAPGSSISHWDTLEFPNQLMEPFINGDLTHNVSPPADLTRTLLGDEGW
ncbi:MAG TPA: PA domain-containing protein [Candidatus Sulfotelmatobacter sp.]|nr:PA domain-containing protein [Candidatus Sulfotelmatobacter sp.]